MARSGVKFGRKQEEAIAALLTQRNVEEAARTAGVGTRTLLRWLKMPEFDAAYRQARRAAFAQDHRAASTGFFGRCHDIAEIDVGRRHSRPLRGRVVQSPLSVSPARRSSWRISKREWQHWKGPRSPRSGKSACERPRADFAGLKPHSRHRTIRKGGAWSNYFKRGQAVGPKRTVTRTLLRRQRISRGRVRCRDPAQTIRALAIRMRANLHRRLKRLEARVKPADEPEEFVIEFIGPGKEVVRTLVIRPGAPSAADQLSPIERLNLPDKAEIIMNAVAF